MKNEALYNKTVGILVDAYMNDTLEHYNCYACAVGNIIAANNGFTFRTPNDEDSEVYVGSGSICWDKQNEFSKNPLGGMWRGRVTRRFNTFQESLISSTNYSASELAEIEFAFESVHNTECDDDKYMFDGLMAVIDCLDKIHENTDTVITETSKKKFNKQLV